MSAVRYETLDGLLPFIPFYRRVSVEFTRAHRIALARHPDGGILFVTDDVEAWPHRVNLSKLFDVTLMLVVSDAAQIAHFNNTAYEELPSATLELTEGLKLTQLIEDVTSDDSDLLQGRDEAPVIQLVNHLLLDAIKAEASDIHLQPSEEHLLTRLRIDGTLYDHVALPKAIQAEVTSRIKVLARMNIAEKRLPQDGRSTVEVGDRLIDLRISSVPTDHGERVVIRLLDKSARMYRLADLGMSETVMKRFDQLIRLEHGLILVTGPTGSGKTTTLYAALQELDATRHNILTIEDPIEYRLPRISQMQVSTKKGMTFVSGLRSMLRQDPDIIMVGEIRDRETAAIAIQSALTGHLVFSTLHTNDAASAVTRLLELGVEPYLLASCLVGVLAQRLVRVVCRQCGATASIADDELTWLQPSERFEHQRLGSGCDRCRGSGFRGRIGVFELLLADGATQEGVHNRATADAIRAGAIERGMIPMRIDGLAKVRSGLTSIAEVMRVARI